MSGSYRLWGVVFALAGTIAFAFRPVLIKLGYAAHPVSATTLLFLRMTLALPFFLAMAWWLRGANHFALIGALGPVTTVLADFGLLGGVLTAAQMLGGALVIFGVLLVSLKRS